MELNKLAVGEGNTGEKRGGRQSAAHKKGLPQEAMEIDMQRYARSTASATP